MSTKIREIEVPQDTAPINWLRAWLDDVRAWVRARDPSAATVGDPLDKFTTRRELTDAGLLQAKDSSPTVTRKHTRSIGNGTLTSITVAHGLGTKDVTVMLRNNSTGAISQPATSVVADTTNTVVLTFGAAPALDAYTAIIIG